MAIKKITNFIFPAGDKTLSQDAYYRALSEAKNGFYPFGENGLWHGGIHIDAEVLRQVGRNDNKIRCMANGEVIAYRVNNVYPKASYGFEDTKGIPYANNKEKTAYFSTSFTLVRHYFVMPKVPPAPAPETDTANSESAPADTTPSPPPSMTLYSLYMHQLDNYGYQQKEALADISHPIETPTYWHLYKGKVNTTTKEKIKGTAIRLNGSKTEIIGLLLKGSKIKLGDEIKRYEEGEKKKRISRGWYKLESLDSGCIVTESEVYYQLDSLSGYVYKDDLNETIELDNTAHKEKLYSIKKEDNDLVGANKKKVPGIIVYDQPNSETILSYLPTGISFEFDGDENGYAKITQIQGNYIPSPLIITEAAQGDPTHKGWVKISNLSALKYKPKALDKVVILDKPIPIAEGDFIGYLGHSVSRKNPYYQYDSPLPKSPRPEDNALEKLSAQLGHIELFTGDDLPSFITKTRALADRLPESEKSLIIVEQGAQLIIENLADGLLPQGLQIQATTPHNQSYYIQVKTSYILTLNRNQVFRDNIISANPLSTESSIVTYRLTAEDKSSLVYRYQFQYPELTEAAIPNQVELIGYHDYSDNNRLLLSNLVLDSNDDQIKIRFSKDNHSLYWIKAMDVIHLHGGAGQITQPISYWNAFPLSLNNLPIASIYNTVHYTRTLPLSSISESNQIVIDEQFNSWIYITAGNVEGSPIKGWVNISKGETDYLQPHIKRASSWEWIGFDTVTETENVANLVEKIQTNRKMTLDLADYTESMSALHHILTETPISQQLPYVLPPFTEKQLKEGLRTSWTAEQIGRLAVKYESEWYADESLSKWNEIDDFYEQERQTKQAAIQKELEDKPAAVEYALEVLTEKFKSHINEWNIEKNQRIKPSLWWNEVVTAQQAQTESTTTPVLSKLPADGKVWHLHPVGMGIFQARKCFCHRDFTVDELTSIILGLRSLENISSEELFNDSRATRMGVNLSVRERSFSNFTTHINRVFRNFEINTCLRKIHFLAQTYVETDRFRSPVEYNAMRKTYAPYYGRGLIHLTHAEAYERYQSFSNIACYNTPNLVINSIAEICNSGAWYWRQGKVLTGNRTTMIWTTSEEEGGSYKMEIYQYIGIPSGRVRQYRAVDFNLIADDDKINLISYLINGGLNGRAERISAYNMLKTLFDYENICINFK